jgi:hypothetical protein
MSDAIRIEAGQDRIAQNTTSRVVDVGRFSIQNNEPESDYPTGGARVIEFEIPNELTLKAMTDADAGIDIVVCEDEEDFFRKLNE